MTTVKRKYVLISIVFAFLAVAIALYKSGFLIYYWQKVADRKTVEDILSQQGAKVDQKYRALFISNHIEYPPSELLVVAYKEEKVLELWGRSDKAFVLLKSYPIQKASGHLGPKLVEGDQQVPEGIYGIEGLNPNSRFYLSMKINYPNRYDTERGRVDGRSNLGNDIFIHGKSASVGCLAMGDEVAEDLFVLVARAGIEKVKVIIAPNRAVTKRTGENYPDWIADLYKEIRKALQERGIIYSGRAP